MTMSHQTLGAPARLEDRYFDRMAQAVPEKTALLPHLVPGGVADVGAGGGQLSQAMARLSQTTEVWAIDNAPDSIRRLHQLPGIIAVDGSTERLAEIAVADPIANVVFSSVLHEIYSYAAPRHPFGAESSRRRAHLAALKHAVDALTPGGRLIIRDFVLPDDAEDSAWLITPGDWADRLVFKYLERTPFDDLRVLDEVDDHVFAGTRRTVSEALLTLSWGAESLPRESQERYGLQTLQSYTDHVLALSHDLTLVTAEAEIQPGYVEHLNDWAVWARTECDENGIESIDHWFPETKALWVFEKKSR